MRKFAHVGIKPVGDQSTTANVLGSVLGELVFAEDTRRRYDEYPAYVAEHDGLRYALLGIPVPEDDLREVRTDDFELMVEPASPQVSDSVKADISNELIFRIRKDGRLECWSLE